MGIGDLVNALVVFRVICGWCQAVLVEGTPGALTSHSMCQKCFDETMSDLDTMEAV